MWVVWANRRFVTSSGFFSCVLRQAYSRISSPISTIYAPKCVFLAKEVPFGVSTKNGYPLPLARSQILKILHYVSRFSLQTRITLATNANKFRSRINYVNFKFWVKNLTGSRQNGRSCAVKIDKECLKT